MADWKYYLIKIWSIDEKTLSSIWDSQLTSFPSRSNGAAGYLLTSFRNCRPHAEQFSTGLLQSESIHSLYAPWFGTGFFPHLQVHGLLTQSGIMKNQASGRTTVYQCNLVGTRSFRNVRYNRHLVSRSAKQELHNRFEGPCSHCRNWTCAITWLSSVAKERWLFFPRHMKPASLFWRSLASVF